ncbi:MAG TPA: ribonuclease HII [Ignavibacteria bacterium]|nr:ribonuclease HII [Ignavibacteria bacterium]
MIICGIDEAGRGPLAGPVVIAAAVMGRGARIEEVRDSKKLSPKKREVLYEIISREVIKCHTAILSNDYIDEHNILKSVMKGMEECIEAVKADGMKFLIDGNYFRLENGKENKFSYETIVKGDDKVYEISCASIIAKVTRDRIMEEYDKIYPVYGFRTNKGYGTAEHIKAILRHGPCEIHRKSFLKNILIKIPLF